MPRQLLDTKLYIPRMPAGLVPRTRLIRRLDEGCAGKLILVSAPAGSGKTTLLGEWTAHCIKRQIPVAWLSLDERDNELQRFWMFLLGALEQVGFEPDDTLAFADTLSSDLLTALIDKIAIRFALPFILVIDDYHAITSAPIHQAVDFVLEHMPPEMHLVISCRREPPLHLARLRASGQLLELRAADLRFDADEEAGFLNRSMGLGLTGEMISALDERTEGWIAGLQLAGLSLRSIQDKAGFIHKFSGTHHYIVDYLAEQVLLRQSPSVQAFLLETSILDRLCAPLCEAVTGQSNGQAILEWLEHANLFLIPLDPEQHWYRYHHLFADLLRSRLAQQQPERLTGLHARAARGFQSLGLLEEAVDHALAAKDFVLASQLVEQVKITLWNRSEALTLMNWFRNLPEELVCSQPSTCASFAAGLVLTGYLESAEHWLEIFDSMTLRCQATDQVLKSYATVWRSVIARFRGDNPMAIALAQQALAHNPNGSLRNRGICLLFLGQAYYYAGDSERANQVLIQAVQLNRASGHVAAFLNASHHAAQLRVLQGRLHEAQALYQQAIEHVAHQPQKVFVGIERVGLGDLYREWNQLDKAREWIDEGLRLAEAGGDILFLRDAYIARARLAQAQGDSTGALALIHKGEQIARRSTTSLDNLYLQAWRARLQLAQGDRAAARYWVDSFVPWRDEELDFVQAFAQLILARVLLAFDRAAEAIPLLKRLDAAAEMAGHTGRLIEIQVLRSRALNALGKPRLGLQQLDHALSLAGPEGYVRLFLDEGPALAVLMDQLARSSSSVAPYARHLYSLLPRSPAQPSPSLPAGGTLGEGELEILRLIAAGRSYQQVAKERVIALSTVQWHIKNIYQKLDVHSGREAIARARELGILT